MEKGIDNNVLKSLDNYIKENFDVLFYDASFDFKALRKYDLDLKNHLENLDKSFSEKLIETIDSKGLTDPEVYKRANIDRKLFWKIKNNKNYKPSKKTALALALSLELSIDEIEELLKSAEYTLSNSSKFDLIVKYFVENNEFNLFKINEYLYEYNEETF